MLDGGNLDVAALQRRPHHGVTDVLGMCLDVGTIEIRATEHDTCVHFRGPQGHEDLFARV